MAAKKSRKKKSAAKATKKPAKKAGSKATKKKTAGKAPARATRKKASKKKTAAKPAKKKASTKAATKPASKKAAKKAAAKPVREATREEVPAQPAAKRAAPSGAGTVTAAEVHLGHIMALRPRVRTAFPPERLRRAKSLLSEERYASIEEAARAVAEKALEDDRQAARKPKGRGPF